MTQSSITKQTELMEGTASYLQSHIECTQKRTRVCLYSIMGLHQDILEQRDVIQHYQCIILTLKFSGPMLK